MSEDDCAVLGYLTVSDQLVVLVQPVGPGAVLRCYREAERLAGLFQQSSARLQAHLLLSAVVAVDLLPAPVTTTAPGAAPGAAPLSILTVNTLTLLVAGLTAIMALRHAAH